MEKLLKIAFLVIAFLLILLEISVADQYRVVRTVDGDTIVVNCKGKYEKLRFLCVSIPESVHPDKKQNIPMGKVASDYTKDRLTRKYVDLDFEEPLRGR